jgi:DNA polymerase-1
MNTSRKLYLIDAYALIYRSYYAFLRNPMFNAEGFNTSTVFGFMNTIEDILSKEDPSHLAVAFDYPGGNFRNDIYPLYKANRDATPEEITKSIPVIKELLDAYEIPMLELQGYEADDIIGTIAKKAARDGFEVYMVTPDKDYIQLLEQNISILRPGKAGGPSEVISLNNIRNYFDVESPAHFLEFLALMGDKSDNVPGAPGIGEKTAAKLLLEHGSLDNLFNNLHKLKGKVLEVITAHRENILLAKQLCTICTEVPLECITTDLHVRKHDILKIRPIYQRLNFTNLEKRVNSRISKPEIIQGSLFDTMVNKPELIEADKLFGTIDNTPHNYITINNLEELLALVENVRQLNEFCFDTETTSLNTLDAKLVGISISWKGAEAYYIPFPKQEDEQLKYLEALRIILEDESITKIGQNIKFDILVFKNYSVEVKGKIFDTMLAHYLIEPEQRHNMTYLSEKYLKYTPVPIEDLIGKGKIQINMSAVPMESISQYAAEDADVTYQLKVILEKELADKSLTTLAEDLEMPLVPVLADMEFEGINLDKNALEELSSGLRSDLCALENEIFKLAGTNFNIQSPKQMGDILFDKLGIDSGNKKTKTKQYSTSEDVLLDLVDKHSIINFILDYRMLRKLLNTYVDALPELIHPITKRVHTSFNQALATTGRLSSVNPNLQNIPIKTERGREIRKAFVARDEGHFILSADYSQIELRIMAHMSEDLNMIEAFRNNEDIHTATAAKIYNVPTAEVSREMRNSAKTANFGIIYGISAFGLSQRLKISRKEASDLIEGYFKSFPNVKQYMELSIQAGRSLGYVKTLFGRRRHLPEIVSANHTVRGMAERNAINSPIQGTAADIIKLAMIRIHNKLKEHQLKTKMILQVHDELVFDVPAGELETVKVLVKAEMENAVSLKVPLLVEVGYGKNWLEAH